MLWTQSTRRNWNPWRELDDLQREMNRLFEPFVRSSSPVVGEFPAVNIWSSENEAILTAEIPGVDPENVDITVKNDTLTIRGERERESLEEGHSYIRQERGEGRFVRSFSLPFAVNSDDVKADYRTGILQVRLPRAAEDKPKRITVNAG